MSCESYTEKRRGFKKVLDFFGGTGFLERTPLFIGWYPAKLGRSSASYHIHLACILSCAAAYVVSLVYTIKKFSHWLRSKSSSRNISLYSSHLFVNMIFRGWDFSIAKSCVAETEKKLLITEIRATQCDKELQEKREQMMAYEKCKIYAIRIIANVIVVPLLTFGGWYAIYRIETGIWKKGYFWEEYDTTITVVLLNKILPEIFEILLKFEQYSNEKMLLILTLRRIGVKFITIGIIWWSEISDNPNRHTTEKCTPENQCWETKLGQNMYQLIIIESIVQIPRTLLFIVRCYLSKIRRKCCKILAPHFDISDEVLCAVYLQALCWMGLIVSPLLPLVTVCAFLLKILLNSIVILKFNLQQVDMVRASRSSSIFIFAILVGLCVSLFPVIWTVTSLRPSPGCSPYRGLDFPITSVVYSLCAGPQWIK